MPPAAAGAAAVNPRRGPGSRLLPRAPAHPATLLPHPSPLCSYFFDRPDDEAPENRVGGLAADGRRAAASKSFAGQLADSFKGEAPVGLSLA